MKLKAFTVSAALSLAALAAPAHAAISAVSNGINGSPTASGKNGFGAFMDADLDAGSFKDTYSFKLTKTGSESVNLSYFGAGFKSLMATFDSIPVLFKKQNDGSFYGSLSSPVLSNSATQVLVVSGVAANDTASYSGNFRFTGAVPEPASWALMIMGVGVAGTMRRRRSLMAAGHA